MVLKVVSSAGGGSSLTYVGTWDAKNNVPTLTSSVGTANQYYIVSTAGNTNLNGITTWNVGDWAIFNGTVWERILGGTTESFANITVSSLTGYMYANGSNIVSASTTIPVANVTGAVPNTVNVLSSGLLSGGGPLTGNVTINLSSVPVANVPGAVPNTVNVLSGGLLTGGGALTGNVTIALANVPSSNVTGLGTMATQNANNVAITGGNVSANIVQYNTNTAATATFATPSLPLVPAGYLYFNLNGTLVKVPYYGV